MIDVDQAARQPGEALVRQVGAGQFLQNVPRLRTGEHEHANRIGQIVETDRSVIRHMLLDPVMVEPLARAGGNDIEAVGGFTLDRIFGMHAAAFGQGVRERYPPDALRQLVRRQPVEERLGAGTGNTAFREGRHVEKPGMLGRVAHLVADMLEPVRAAERPVVFLRRSLGREPVGALPAEFLPEHGAKRLQPVIAGRGAERPRGAALLVRIVDDEDVLVRLLVLRLEVGFGGVAAIAARVDAKHVDGRLALDNPFGKLPAGAAGGGDAETVALAEPEIRQVPGRADDRIAVRRIGDGAVIDLLHPGFAESGNAVHGGFDMRLQTLQILLEQLIFGIGARPVDIACRRAGLVGAENQPAGLLAHVPAAVRIAKNAHFRQAPWRAVP